MDKEIENILTYIGLSMLVILPLMLYAFVLIDKIIKQMYMAHHQEWIKSGKPCGMFYHPAESRSIQSMMAMQFSIFVWIFKTPEWIKNDTLSLADLKRLRLTVIIANILLLALFVFVATTIYGLVK